MFLQPGLCSDVSKTDDGLSEQAGKDYRERSTPGIAVVVEFFFLVEFERDLALIGFEVKERRAGLSAGNPVVGPGFTAEKAGRLAAGFAPVLDEPGLVLPLQLGWFQ